jgi:CheY-like chemotaxis protein
VSVRLLLIEDNPGDAIIFREKLNESDLDFELVHTQRLEEALALIDEQIYDLILCDLSLPDARGLEAVVRVRERAPDRPLIVLTGLDDATAAAQARHEGAVDYLVKWYVDGPSLARYIRYAITQFRMQIAAGGVEETAHDSDAAVVPPPEPVMIEQSSEGDGQSASPVDEPESRTADPGTEALRVALDSSGDGIVVARRDRQILFANATAREWIGDGNSYPWPVAVGERAVRREGRHFVQHSASGTWDGEACFVVTLRETAPQPEDPTVAAPLAFATEAALGYLEVMERRTRWMGDILRSALDLHQYHERRVEVKREIVDLAELAAAAGKDHRQEALARGLPLRVSSGRKKVIASADRNVVCHLLRRIVTDALQTAQASGVELAVDVEGHTSVIRVTWDPPAHNPRGTMSTVHALARDVAERLAERSGGRYEVDDYPGERTVTIRLPASDDVEL